jgi:CubicO group peptidase (beta-lactamase class C family)
MVLIYSATKGLAAMTLAIAHSRGWLDYEERIHVLTRVRAARQAEDHRPPTPGAPGGEDVHIRVPEEIPNSRLATLAPPGRIEMLVGFRPLRLMVEGMNPRSNIYRALVTNPGFAIAHDDQHVYARNLEVPSGGAIGTARAIAHAYGVFAEGGAELGLRQETLDLPAAPAIPPTHGFHDECLKGEVQFSLGFLKPSRVWRFGSARSFGSPGSGGCLGFADPADGIGYGYVTSQMGATFTGDPRDVALRGALYSALRSHEGLPPAPQRRVP